MGYLTLMDDSNTYNIKIIHKLHFAVSISYSTNPVSPTVNNILVGPETGLLRNSKKRIRFLIQVSREDIAGIDKFYIHWGQSRASRKVPGFH